MRRRPSSDPTQEVRTAFCARATCAGPECCLRVPSPFPRSRSGVDELTTGKVIDQNGAPVRELRVSGSRKSVDFAITLIRKCWTESSATDMEAGECNEGE